MGKRAAAAAAIATRERGRNRGAGEKARRRESVLQVAASAFRSTAPWWGFLMFVLTLASFSSASTIVWLTGLFDGSHAAGTFYLFMASLVFSALFVSVLDWFLPSENKEVLKGQTNAALRYGQKLGQNIRAGAERHGFTSRFLSWKYQSRLVCALVFNFGAMYLNVLASVVAGYRTPNIRTLHPVTGQVTGARTLPDLGHDLYDWMFGSSSHIGIPPGASIDGPMVLTEDDMFWLKLPDKFVSALQVPLILLVFSHPRRLQILRRLACIWGFISLLRGVCVAVTSLPDASPMCTSQFGDAVTGKYKGEAMFPKAFKRALDITLKPGTHVTCGDMVFSGHTVFYMLVCMTFAEYFTWKNCNTPFMRMFPRWLHIYVLVRWIVYAIALCAMCATVGTRLHYTLDVVAAVYLTWRSWNSYHSRCDKYNKSTASAVIQWLEDDDVIMADEKAYIKSRDRSTSIATWKSSQHED